MARMKPLAAGISASIALFCFFAPAPGAWGSKKSVKSVTAANGSPIRKVYIQSASAEMTDSATTQLTQDTCLTIVPDAKQADAVLDVGIALPDLGTSGGGSGSSSPDGSGSSPHPHTMGGNGNPAGNDSQKEHRSATATCTDGKGNSGCSGSYTAPRGGLAQPAAEWPGGFGTNFTVSLASPADASQELWEPNDRSKKSWSDQLRAAAGCPVCPGEHFNRRKYQSYRQWIQAECPAVLAAR